MFKVGDKVVCVRGYEDLVEGTTYTISQYNQRSDYPTYLVEEILSGWWEESRFVLASEYSAQEQLQAETKTALDIQHGGGHYKGMKIQPVEFIHANNIGYMEGNAIKYLCRWQLKNGLEDLNKAKHYIELLIEMENERESKD